MNIRKSHFNHDRRIGAHHNNDSYGESLNGHSNYDGVHEVRGGCIETASIPILQFAPTGQLARRLNRLLNS